VKYFTDFEFKSKRGNLKYLDKLREISRKNRNSPTEAEFIMWQFIRKNNFGYKFTRQKPLVKFILDFYCSELLLDIEIDGGCHIKNQAYDLKRDKYLSYLNIKTIRFTNDEVLKGFEKIREKFLPLIKGRCSELKRGERGF
jgi:very-short-patch-repair endonuclease